MRPLKTSGAREGKWKLRIELLVLVLFGRWDEKDHQYKEKME